MVTKYSSSDQYLIYFSKTHSRGKWKWLKGFLVKYAISDTQSRPLILTNQQLHQNPRIRTVINTV